MLRSITPAEAGRLRQADATLVDLWEAEEHAEPRILGACNLPPSRLAARWRRSWWCPAAVAAHAP